MTPATATTTAPGLKPPKREVYALRWNRTAQRWHCPQTGQSTAQKQPLLRQLAQQLRKRWRSLHIPCQLRVYGQHGRIQFERTYGRDPKRYPG